MRIAQNDMAVLRGPPRAAANGKSTPASEVPPMTAPEPDDADSRRHRRRLAALADRLPGSIRGAIWWLLRPKSRWARIPAGVLLVLGGVLGMLPVLGFWMLPLGLVLIGEDVPLVRRGVNRVLAWIERRWPRRP